MSTQPYLCCYILEAGEFPPTSAQLAACQEHAAQIRQAVMQLQAQRDADAPAAAADPPSSGACPAGVTLARLLHQPPDTSWNGEELEWYRGGCARVCDDDPTDLPFADAVQALWTGQYHRARVSRLYDVAVRDLDTRRLLVAGETCTEDEPQGPGFSLCELLDELNLLPLLGWR